MAERLLLPTAVYNVLASKTPPERAPRWPQETSKTLPERLLTKVLVLPPVVDVVAAVVVDPPSPLPSASAACSSSSSSSFENIYEDGCGSLLRYMRLRIPDP